MKLKGLNIAMFLILISSCSYVFSFYIGSLFFSFDTAKITNMLFAAGIFSITLITLLQKQKIISFTPLNVYAILLLELLIIGVFSNSIIEILPSLFRFGMYYFLAIVTYQFIVAKGLDYFTFTMKRFVFYLMIFSLVFGYAEVFFQDIEFLNGAYRLSGSFKGHPLGNSMFLAAVLILWIEYYFLPKKNLINIVILMALAYLFINTHSRMPLLFLIISYVSFSVLKLKKIIKAFKVFIGVVVVLVGAYFLVINTDLAPRLKTVFLSKKSLKDSSTKTRIEIAENTYYGMSSFEKIAGIGLGGFNGFYKETTGKDGVAAHNNFLLFYSEGGIIGLLIFLFYQVILFITLFRFIRKKIQNYGVVNNQRLIFVSVFLFEICSFLLNNYYFFTSQSIVFILMGLMTYLIKHNDKNLDLVENFSV
ncbi:O-antigen ligase family protein [Aquimarina aggregata]|uniref:O-antigen ligase family protein n=1 Tax=Aquimarina aggregata TaxID=1642818 RepID=UPI0024934D11|nr:O-antigen ligase family protein [Aquimarina aggregata]